MIQTSEKTIRLHRVTFICLLLTVMLSSCSKNVVYSKYQTFENNEWQAGNRAIFDIEITDNQTLNNIYLMIRHTESYPYSNLFLFVTSSYPDGKILKDTMEIVLANNKGGWVGSGAGDIFDLKVPLKKNVRFPQTGKYKFEFEQAMRVDPLPQIMDFGFEIRKSKD